MNVAISALVTALNNLDSPDGLARLEGRVADLHSEVRQAEAAYQRAILDRAELLSALHLMADPDPLDCGVCIALNDNRCPEHGEPEMEDGGAA